MDFAWAYVIPQFVTFARLVTERALEEGVEETEEEEQEQEQEGKTDEQHRIRRPQPSATAAETIGVALWNLASKNKGFALRLFHNSELFGAVAAVLIAWASVADKDKDGNLAGLAKLVRPCMGMAAAFAFFREDATGSGLLWDSGATRAAVEIIRWCGGLSGPTAAAAKAEGAEQQQLQLPANDTKAHAEDGLPRDALESLGLSLSARPSLTPTTTVSPSFITQTWRLARDVLENLGYPSDVDVQQLDDFFHPEDVLRRRRARASEYNLDVFAKKQKELDGNTKSDLAPKAASIDFREWLGCNGSTIAELYRTNAVLVDSGEEEKQQGEATWNEQDRERQKVLSAWLEYVDDDGNAYYHNTVRQDEFDKNRVESLLCLSSLAWPRPRCAQSFTQSFTHSFNHSCSPGDTKQITGESQWENPYLDWEKEAKEHGVAERKDSGGVGAAAGAAVVQMWADIGIGAREEDEGDGGWGEKEDSESKVAHGEAQEDTILSEVHAVDGHDWAKLRDKDGHEYWHQISTGASQWDAPAFANAWHAASVEAIDEDVFARHHEL